MHPPPCVRMCDSPRQVSFSRTQHIGWLSRDDDRLAAVERRLDLVSQLHVAARRSDAVNLESEPFQVRAKKMHFSQ